MAILARRELGIESILVGASERIDAEIARLGARDLAFEIREASQVVEMGETPSRSLKGKPDSSIRIALETVKQGEASAVFSAGDTVTCQVFGGATHSFTFRQPGWKRFFLPFRLSRRLLRLDKCVVVPFMEGEQVGDLLVVRQGQCYHVDLRAGRVTKTLALRQSRNPLHQSICVTDGDWMLASRTTPRTIPIALIMIEIIFRTPF